MVTGRYECPVRKSWLVVFRRNKGEAFVAMKFYTFKNQLKINEELGREVK